jgi:polyhydroxybutyrate depolymerase
MRYAPHKRAIFAAVVAVIVFGGCLASTPVYSELMRRLEREISVDGLERRYIVYLPSVADPNKALPVVIGFHGAWGTAKSFEEQSEFHNAPRASEFLIVYPNGYRRSWNAGACCGAAKRDRIDDVKFVEEILSDLKSLVPIDQRRIYATGFSNGAMMSYYLACVRAKLIAAIAPAGGAMQGDLSTCRPSRSVPVLHFHGRADAWSPYAGGMSKWKKIGMQRSIGDQVAFWVALNSCRTTEKTTLAGGAKCIRHTQCQGGADVVLCVVDGMGHQWPGDEPPRWSKRLLGQNISGISATDAVLEFFLKHPLP